MNYSSVIIVGAPRSGTNMLRDMLIELSGAGTWPCDEINYIWRHGNVKYPSDEFTPEMATTKVQEYIQRQFQKISEVADLGIVIEKTCANSLRVGFVNKAIPDAKYIFIVRDGMDAVGSAIKRWKASLDIPYILQKARYVPPTDLPYYASRYLIICTALSLEKAVSRSGGLQWKILTNYWASTPCLKFAHSNGRHVSKMQKEILLLYLLGTSLG